jgi:hypothetical protein
MLGTLNTLNTIFNIIFNSSKNFKAVAIEDQQETLCTV